MNRMDNQNLLRRGRPEDATRIDNCGNVNMSLLNAESIFPIPKSISSMSQFAYDNALMVYDLESGLQYGVLKESGMYYYFESSADENRVVTTDLENRRLEVYENDTMINKAGTQAVIDLDTNGRRWEGEVNNGKPYGYGVIYDEEGRKEYEGFMINESKTGYGIEYYSDIDRVQYDGCYYNNNRFGKGTLYDRNGVIEYEGIWKNDTPYSSQFDGKTIDSHTESVVIPKRSLKKPESIILPSFLHSLKRVVIRNGCFGNVRLFEMDGLSELNSVVIGKKSFRISGSERSDGTCRIVNCPKLKSIQIGDWSFEDYHSFELNNLPSLQTIKICIGCFFFAPLFSLTGITEGAISFTELPQLQSVSLSNCSFTYVHSVVFESDGMDGLMIQICHNYYLFSFVHLLFKVILVMIKRRLAMNPSTTRIH